MNEQSSPKKQKKQDSTKPGPTTGGMRSMGPQPGEPTLEEKLGVDAPPQREDTRHHKDDPRDNQGGARQGPPPVPREKTPEAKAEKRAAEKEHGGHTTGRKDSAPDRDR
jgi:hypothetical protein